MDTSFRRRLLLAAEQTGRALDLSTAVSTDAVLRRVRPRTVVVRYAGIQPEYGAAQWEVTVWWAPTESRDPDAGLADWVRLLWETIRQTGVIVDGPTPFPAPRPYPLRPPGPRASDAVVLYEGVTLTVEDPDRTAPRHG